jgi:PKD repeat protein
MKTMNPFSSVAPARAAGEAIRWRFSFLWRVFFVVLTLQMAMLIGLPASSSAAPTAAFSAVPVEGPAPLTVSFLDMSTPS